VVTARLYDRAYTDSSSDQVTFEDAYAATVDVTFTAGTTGACAPSSGSLTIDKPSINHGEEVKFTATGYAEDAQYAVFFDGALVTGGLVSNILYPLPWNAFGSCVSHVVTLRIYNQRDIVALEEVTWQKAFLSTVSVTLNPGPGADCVTPNPSVKRTTTSSKTFSGFAVNSSKLTKKMKAGIKAFLRAHADVSRIDVTGFTMGPVMKADLKLALSRAESIKAYIRSLGYSTKIVVHASRDTKVGPKYRRATIVLSRQIAS
jgi:outer membrane protein OmpA-like peptidoglycan-associated protein